MATSLCPYLAASPVHGVKIFGLAFVSGMAPGFLFGLWASLMQPFSLANLLEHFGLPLLTALIGAIVGAPFSLLAFAPLVSLLSRYWRLSGLHMTSIGFLSVLLVVSGLQLAFGGSKKVSALQFFGGLNGVGALALCGAVAGFAFWLMVGDIDARSGSNDKGQSR